MRPQRMCMVCRERKDKTELIRVTKAPDGRIFIDESGKESGRGAYLCKNAKCLRQAQRRKAFERAFSGAIPANLYEQLQQIAEAMEVES